MRVVGQADNRSVFHVEHGYNFQSAAAHPFQVPLISQRVKSPMPSPGGAKDLSPWREPWESHGPQRIAPEGRKKRWITERRPMFEGSIWRMDDRSRADTARLGSSSARTRPADIDHIWQIHASYAPPGADRFASLSHGLRRGLRSFAPPGLGERLGRILLMIDAAPRNTPSMRVEPRSLRELRIIA
jgi:hypothetical protein